MKDLDKAQNCNSIIVIPFFIASTLLKCKQ